MGYEHNGERYDTLTMAGCADCTVTGNSVISFNRERPVIRLGAGRDTGEKCRHNDVTLNKVLPSTGYEERPQMELTDDADTNLVVLPMAAGATARGRRWTAAGITRAAHCRPPSADDRGARDRMRRRWAGFRCLERETVRHGWARRLGGIGGYRRRLQRDCSVRRQGVY